MTEIEIAHPRPWGARVNPHSWLTDVLDRNGAVVATLSGEHSMDVAHLLVTGTDVLAMLEDRIRVLEDMLLANGIRPPGVDGD